MQLRTLGVIPARYASSRFPGKPLAMIGGKTMIQRVYEQALKSQKLTKAIVATDDERIYNHVTEFGGIAMMTSASHPTGSSRIAEVIEKLSASGKCQYDVVLNIQGDEPFIDPAQIDLAISLFSDPSVQIGTLIMKINNNEDIFNPNIAKVVVDSFGNATCFSRSPIPFLRGKTQDEWHIHNPYYRHIGLYAFGTDCLKTILALPASPNEIAESLEQLTWLYYGFKIRTALTDIDTIGVDVPEDLLRIANKFDTTS